MNNFLKITDIEGVDQYVLVDAKGNVVAHRTDDPKQAARTVLNIGKNLYSIGKTQFKYAIFSRDNKNNLLIFPIGNRYLGVIKQKNVNNMTLINNVKKFLREF